MTNYPPISTTNMCDMDLLEEPEYPILPNGICTEVGAVVVQVGRAKYYLCETHSSGLSQDVDYDLNLTSDYDLDTDSDDSTPPVEYGLAASLAHHVDLDDADTWWPTDELERSPINALTHEISTGRAVPVNDDYGALHIDPTNNQPPITRSKSKLTNLIRSPNHAL
jgi:hypothetical protein